VIRIRVLLASFAVLVVSLALAAPALADKGGEGLYGKTNDKVITNFGFGLMILFTLLVVLLSAAQGLLNRRKGK
jgi:peptidoglycan biosynthesis protein MviN/MurJ (putative lipid II flippase)